MTTEDRVEEMNATDRPTEASRKPFRFGVPKFGNPRHSALTYAVLPGIMLAACISILIAFVGTQEQPLLLFITIFTSCLSPSCISLIWILIVDIDTIPGRTRSPEDSVENAWFSKAAETTCIFTFPAAGIGAAFTTNFRTDLPAVSLTLLAVCTVMALTFAGGYLWEKSHS